MCYWSLWVFISFLSSFFYSLHVYIFIPLKVFPSWSSWKSPWLDNFFSSLHRWFVPKSLLCRLWWRAVNTRNGVHPMYFKVDRIMMTLKQQSKTCFRFSVTLSSLSPRSCSVRLSSREALNWLSSCPIGWLAGDWSPARWSYWVAAWRCSQ